MRLGLGQGELAGGLEKPGWPQLASHLDGLGLLEAGGMGAWNVLILLSPGGGGGGLPTLVSSCCTCLPCLCLAV